jgi:hypothetical protein
MWHRCTHNHVSWQRSIRNINWRVQSTAVSGAVTLSNWNFTGTPWKQKTKRNPERTLLFLDQLLVFNWDSEPDSRLLARKEYFISFSVQLQLTKWGTHCSSNKTNQPCRQFTALFSSNHLPRLKFGTTVHQHNLDDVIKTGTIADSSSGCSTVVPVWTLSRQSNSHQYTEEL